MTNVVSMKEYIAKKEIKAQALQYAKYYNMPINVAKDIIKEMSTQTTAVTRIITEAEALEALEGAITTEQLMKLDIMEEQVIGTLDDTVTNRLEDGDYDILDVGLEEYAKRNDINIIQWNPDIPW